MNKSRLKEEAESYVNCDKRLDAATNTYIISEKPVWRFDQHGDHDQVVLERVYNNAEGPKCWLRVFVPDNDDLADNWRLEVVTTPDDTEIVGWETIVD
jgi:hypothetical protein